MSRFIVLAFPREPHGGRKGRGDRRHARRIPFDTELEGKVYANLMHKESNGRKHFHVIDQQLKATTYRV